MSSRGRLRALSGHGDGGGGHDGGGMMRWLLTYADVITLLTAFFIMMYSMSVINLQKFNQVAIAIKSGFNGEQLGAGLFDKGGVVYVEEDKQVPTPAPELDRVMKLLDDYIAKHDLKNQVMCRLEERGLVISLSSDGLLFERGQAQLRPGAKTLLDDIGRVVCKLQNEVLVEGNTCDLPIATPAYPSNWELSTARATTVVRYLIEQHQVSASHIGAAGYADTRPVAKNDTEEHRRLNRRVDMVVLSGLATLAHDAQVAPATPPANQSKAPQDPATSASRPSPKG